MAVVTTVVMDETNGAFTPFRGIDRRGGPVGTYHATGTVVGAAGGGTAKVILAASFLMFGFHPLLVPRMVTSRDNLASAEDVLLGFGELGNERLTVEQFIVGRSLKTASSLNIASWPLDDIRTLIEPQKNPASGTVMTFTWDTNTDTKTYLGIVFFMVYDLEVLAAYPGAIPDGVFLNS